jgi:hypothetical protein
MKTRGAIGVLGFLLASCSGAAQQRDRADAPKAVSSPAPPAVPAGKSFGDDLAFLNEHTTLVVLKAADGRAQVAVAPEYQGRVLTSTASGRAGPSFGWINRDVIAARKRQPHMTVFGGEDRFWLGPEGGQYALYFPPGAAFEFDHWQVPEGIDWGAWPITGRSQREVRFKKQLELVNYAGTRFRITVDRTVRLLDPRTASVTRAAPAPSATSEVAYESVNTITNSGASAWTPETGLISIWILGMFQPTPQTVIVIPFRPGPESELGAVVNDAYFGKVPEARLRVTARHLFFRGDGTERGKIGIPARRALPVAGSYDGAQLTIVEYTLPDAASGARYVNSMWEHQKQPYAGDVVNSYNDGPPAPGKKPLGPFYEIETSSPGAALAPGQSLTHVHRTVHVQGSRAALDAMARAKLGVGLSTIETAFDPK